MIKTVLFDVDGVIIHREMYFSQRFCRESGTPMEKVLPFFNNEFRLCLVGQADLKQELAKYLNDWNWKKSVGDLLAFWFEHESDLDKRVLDGVCNLRNRGIRCYLATNNEKYRVQYILGDLGLEKHFDGAISSAEAGFLKPQPEFWSAVHDFLNKPDKTEVLFWDDDTLNVVSSIDFGYHSEVFSGADVFKSKMKSLIG
ncbi:MAG: HAD family hydrolase [Patescibacteria group bacterium]|mgnify:FL=1